MKLPGLGKSKLFFVLIIFNFFLLIFSCQKELDDYIDNVQEQAEGSLTDSNGICLNSEVKGTFLTGIVPKPDTAYIQVQVNVTKTGSYVIHSDLQNGLQFSDSGLFSSTGINIISLKPAGKPIIPAATTFTLNFDSSICNFTVNVKDSAQTIPVNQDSTGNNDPDANGVNIWQFTSDEGTFSGSFDTATLTTNTTSGLTYLLLSGRTNKTKDSVLRIKVIFPGSAIKLGTYITQGESAAGFEFTDKLKNEIYYAFNDENSASLMTINVILYDKDSGIIEGLINGKANNQRGNPEITITGGAFETTVAK